MSDTSNITSIVSGSSFKHFQGFHEDTTLKIVFTTFSTFVNMINNVLFYGIIVYEQYGTDNRKTLINKIVSMI